MNTLQIYKMVSHKSKKPFRIAEVFVTIDDGGFRTRLTSNCFSTLEEAQYFVKNNQP